MAATQSNSPALGLRGMRSRLLRWFDSERRDLPWRRNRDPYRIWVSEVMLQQTRVNAVLSYYEPFLKRFPDVHALAAAEESSVLAAWSGLGYYRRARAMHHCAQKLVSEREGEFPKTPAELRKLPGIGEYTSAAIASIAFDFPAAVVDGNVERVLSRLFALRTPKASTCMSLAQWLLDPRRPGDWNQAMMELGATVCTPVQPKCPACPLRSKCQLPGADTTRARVARRKISVVYGLARRNGQIKLVQRLASARVMPNMWELPSVLTLDGQRVLTRRKHSITVTDYDVTVVELLRSPRVGVWTELAELPSLPLTGLTRKVLRQLGLLATSTEPKEARRESNR